GTSGHWCGYVGLNEGHPLYGKGYDDAHDEADIDVHGGLTFADSCQPSETESRGVCHIPGEGEPDHVWWLGFDCAHAWDYSPRDKAYEHDPTGIYRIGFDQSYKTLGYVKNQCAALARQLNTPQVLAPAV